MNRRALHGLPDIRMRPFASARRPSGRRPVRAGGVDGEFDLESNSCERGPGGHAVAGPFGRRRGETLPVAFCMLQCKVLYA